MICTFCQGAQNIMRPSPWTCIVPIPYPPEMLPCPKCDGTGVSELFGPAVINARHQDRAVVDL